MTAAQYFNSAILSAQKRYQQTRDWNAYLADCAYAALQCGASVLASNNPRLRHLGTALTGASYTIKGLIDQALDEGATFSCPVDEGHDHEQFLIRFVHHTQRFLDRDTQSVRDVLEHMGLLG
jgi:hypothetical protein